MSIVVTARGAGMGAWIDEDFAHCRQVVIATGDGKFTAWENPFINAGSGADLARRMSEEVADLSAVVTARIDADAALVFAKRGIPVYLSQQGAVLELLESAAANRLPRA